MADDTRGAPIDPTSAERTPTPELVENARRYLALRFPALAGAPLIETRVCQYENSPDGDFLIDRHPEAGNVWLAGGGSGHGFKLGPAVGEHTAGLVLGEEAPRPKFSLSRLTGAAASRRTQFEAAVISRASPGSTAETP
jgi:glycine/D-amino acid oxidase-like deaminating enzyme